VARPQVADGGDGLQMWRAAENVSNKQYRTADRGWQSRLGVGRGLTTPNRKKQFVTKCSVEPRTWTESGHGNRVLRRMSGCKRDELTGEWRKLHSGELRNLYFTPNVITQIKSGRMKWGGHVARMGERQMCTRVLVGKPEGERPLGRPRRRWEDGIKMDRREIGWGGGGVD
jgi:hypothetical protein